MVGVVVGTHDIMIILALPAVWINFMSLYGPPILVATII